MNHHGSKVKFALAAAAAALAAFAPAASATPDVLGKKAVAEKLAIAAPSSVEAGANFDLTVRAVSKKGKPIKTFKGSVALKSTDAGATLPGAYKFRKSDKGRHVFTGVSLATAGSQLVTATGPKAIRGAYSVTVNGAGSGGSGSGSGGPDPAGGETPVDPGTTPGSPGPLAAFELSAPASVEAGHPVALTARGADAAGNDLGDVTGRLNLAVGPDGSCTAATCSATTAGPHTVTATIGGITRTAQVMVSAGPIATIDVAAPASVEAGEYFSPTATARDQYGNPRGDVTARTTFSVGGSACAGRCREVAAGNHTVTGRVDGISGTASFAVRPGPLASIQLSAPNGEIAPGTPGTSSAQYTATRPTSKQFTAMGRDAWGNSLGNVTAQTSFRMSDRNCPNATCSGGNPSSTERMVATNGSVTAEAMVVFASLADSYEMACRGDYYDVNGNMIDGCERWQPDGGHTTRASAIDLGSKSCNDNDSRTTFSGVVLSDNRRHVDPSRSVGYTPPTVYKVRATGGVCVNDMAISVRTSGGADGAQCYRVTVNTNYYEDSGTYDGNESREGSTGARYYADNSDLYITVERICGDQGPEAVDYTISFRL